jgi:glycosyltransferase involved in cell wall biosynthesis
VATDTGGSGEYLRDGENCLLFTPRDSAQALAESVRRLEADPGLRGHLREGGIATAERFTETAYNEAISAALAKGADSLGGAHG